MTISRKTSRAGSGPKQRQKHYSYNENVDEPAKLIKDEATDIEHEMPEDENEPVQTADETDRPDSPAFEE